ncbi:hypothetical protein [Lagierella sp.]|uniref:hypothetical protein n=1 Tax=Lagierella sp. TaxID=2849657 RepID=UPI00262D9FED|nr:hypothetical protein [Lagierella sp.]
MENFFKRLLSLNPQLLFELLKILEAQKVVFMEIENMKISNKFPKELCDYIEISNKILNSIETENLQMTLKFYNKNKVVKEKVNLNFDFTYTKPQGYRLYRGEIKEIHSYKDLYIELCKYFYQKNQKIFKSFIDKTDFNGRTRPYFSKKSEKLINPEYIGDQIFIETSFSANKIRDMLIKIFKTYNVNYSILEIFIKQDRKDKYGYYENK